MINQVLKLSFSDFISVNHYLAYRAIIKNGRPMAMSYKTKEAKDFQNNFEEYVKEQVKEQGWITDTNPLQHYYVDTVVYFPRIDMDMNNYYKTSLDSITNTGLVWVDDNVVCERVNHIYYDSENPHIEFTIYPVDYIGIFNTKEECEQFENKCKQCSRYKRKCSILKKAQEGRIQNEIDMHNYECAKYKIEKKGK